MCGVVLPCRTFFTLKHSSKKHSYENWRNKMKQGRAENLYFNFLRKSR